MTALDVVKLALEGGALGLLGLVLLGGYRIGQRIIDAAWAIERRLATLEEQARRYHDLRDTPPEILR